MACASWVDKYNSNDEDGKAHHNLTKLLLEHCDVDKKSLQYSSQEDQAELVKSFSDSCSNGNDVEASSTLSEFELSSPGGLQWNQMTGYGMIDEHKKIDSDNNWSPDRYDQSIFSNLSSINTTGSFHHALGCTFHEAGRPCYTNIGHELIHIMKCMSVIERRPLMAIAVEHTLNHDMEILLGEEISNYEWSTARAH
jgi:hypothetical protein